MGFTLIELLAVIVILAVLALIATPIVLNIIEDSKKNATLRSSENYIKAVEFSIAKSVMDNKRLSDGTYPLMSDGNICLGTKTGDTCDNELVVEVSGETPESGTITIKSRKIDSYNFVYSAGFAIQNGEIQNLDICTLLEGNANEVGSKYECKVKEGTTYNFYVLSHNDDGTTNLIMERNICEDGTVATADNKCKVSWYESPVTVESVPSFGPVTAMNYVYNATKKWDNIPNLAIDYQDEGKLYGSIKTEGKTTKITKLDGTVTATYENLKARLPKYEGEVHGTGKCLTYAENNQSYLSCPLYLSNYLELSSYVTGSGVSNVSGVRGYWTLSTLSGSQSAMHVYYYGNVVNTKVASYTWLGVRPVITLMIY